MSCFRCTREGQLFRFRRGLKELFICLLCLEELAWNEAQLGSLGLLNQGIGTVKPARS